MRKASTVVALLAAAALVSAPVQARNGHGGHPGGGGGGGGGHAGGHGHRGGAHFSGGTHFSGGYRHHGGLGVVHGGNPVRVPTYSPPLAAYPAPRIYSPPVHVHPVHPRPVYVAPRVIYPVAPIVRYAPAPYYVPPVVTYVQPAEPQQYWYYCTDYQAYYPYVESCPSEWLRVLPNP